MSDRALLDAQLERTAHDLGETLVALAEERASRERVEAELRLAHRLEAVGQLAAGVAHEINTPIQYAGDSVRFLETAFGDVMRLLARIPSIVERLETLDPAEAARLAKAFEEADAEFVLAEVPAAVGRALDGIDSVAGIVRAMKAFAHPGTGTKTPADLNEALTATLAIARNEYKYVADVETAFGPLPLVPCQLAELNQVFLNLLVNAAHAVAERVAGTSERGTIKIETTTTKDAAVIRIADTGAGIPPALRDRIFDPFFTTKPAGKGTGQGLTIARSIVVQHGGSITVDSTLGVGTTFEIRLPR